MVFALHSAQQSIYNDLVADKIGWEEAAKRLEALPPTWQTKEWKANKKKVIKLFCEKCGKTDGTMVVQHPYHPPTIVEIINYLSGNDGPIIQTFIEKAKELLADQYALILPEQRECCPKCGSVAVRWHKTDQVWKCLGTIGKYRGMGAFKTACNYLFSEPSYLLEYSPASKKAIARLNQKAYELAQATKDACWREQCNKYGKEAVIESLRWSSWYLSLEGTKTYCKKCAFLEDKHIIISKCAAKGVCL